MMLYFKPLVDPSIYGELNRTPNQAINLRPNQTLSAEVIDILPSGAAVVKVKGFYVEVKTEIPLQKDTQLLLQVMDGGDFQKSLKLKLLQTIDPKRQKLQQLLEKMDIDENRDFFVQMLKGGMDKKELLNIMLQKGLQKEIAHINKKIDQFFSTLSDNTLEEKKSIQQRFGFLSDLENIDGKKLQKAIYNSGIFYESTLKEALKRNEALQLVARELAKLSQGLITTNDFYSFVKNLSLPKEYINRILSIPLSQLQATLKELEQSAKKDLKKELQEDIKYKLSTLAKQDEKIAKEAKNLQQYIENFQILSHLSGALTTFLPLVWDGLEGGSLSIKRGANHYLCVIDLFFEDIGRVEAKILQFEEDLKIDFDIEDSVFESILRDSLPILQKQLQALGYSTIFFSFTAISIDAKKYESIVDICV